MTTSDSRAPTTARRASQVGPDLLVGAGAMAICALLVLPTFFSNGGDPTLLLRVGTYAPARPYVERSFPDPVLTPDYGHDGQQFYVLAGNLPDLRSATPYVDDIRYRARRILFPLLASPFRDGSSLVWAMFGINLLAIGAGAVAVARLARQLRAPPMIGLLVGATPAMIESLQGSLGDALAFALALWGVVLWRRRLGWAVLLFTLAGLSRETTLVVPLACFIVATNRQRLRLVIPFAVMAAWSLIELAWLPLAPGTPSGVLDDVTKALGAPFKGWIDAGLASPGSLTALVLVVGCAVAAYALWNIRRELAWWLIFDGLLLVVSNAEVVERPFNACRVAPLAVVGLALALTTRRSPTTARPSTALA
jgi:hypothetical protein